MAGLAELKTELVTSKMLDPRLKVKILRTVDTSYGMERGLQEAVTLSEDILADATLTKEKKLLQSFFTEVAKPSGNYATGTKEVLLALEQGVVDLLLCWEELPTLRYTLRNGAKNDEQVIHYTPSNRKKNQEPSIADLLKGKGLDPSGYELIETVPLIEWLCDNYERFGAKLELVSNHSDQGAQFSSGFGGIGAVLRYHVDFDLYEEVATNDDSDSDDDDERDFMFDSYEEDSGNDDDWGDLKEDKPETSASPPSPSKASPPRATSPPPSDEKVKESKTNGQAKGGSEFKLEFVAAKPAAPMRVVSTLDAEAPAFRPKAFKRPNTATAETSAPASKSINY